MNDKNYFIGSFYRRNNEIIFVDSEMRKTVAACSPQDTFDEFEGCRIALCRAYNKPDGIKKFLEGDFLCTIEKHTEYCYLTDGKIYHFKNGNAIGDNGMNICAIPAKTLDDLNEKFKIKPVIKFYKVN